MAFKKTGQWNLAGVHLHNERVSQLGVEQQAWWERRGIDFPQRHVAGIRIGVVRDLDRHEFGLGVQVHHVLEAWAEYASLGATDVAHLIHPAVALAVLDRGVAEQLWLGWVIHDPHLHCDAADVTVALHGDEAATLFATPHLSSREVRSDRVPALGFVLLEADRHIVLTVIVLSPPAGLECVCHLALIFDNFIVIAVLELPLELRVIFHGLVLIQDNSATSATPQAPTVRVDIARWIDALALDWIGLRAH